MALLGSIPSQVAAWVQDMFSIFYLVKSHKIGNDLVTFEARKYKHRFGVIGIL